MGFLRFSLAFIVGLHTFVGLSWAADYALIKDFLGSYPILEHNKHIGVGGAIEVLANPNGVGIVLSPLPLASTPVPQLTLVTPKDPTKLERVGGNVVQEYIQGNERVKIEYQRRDGFIEVLTKRCLANDCKETHSVASVGKSPGKSINPKEFFKSIEAEEYVIELAGGAIPKANNDVASVYLDTTEAIVAMPYCKPGSTVCDPGYQYFPHGDTYVFERVLPNTKPVFILLMKQAEKLRYYLWEERTTQFVFQNFQYTSAGVATYLEHVLKRPKDLIR